ncbi:putative C2 domain-containing protein [Helianthus annuus]|nr:putative C2 domain-containing protein [Helianthus annuus]KAJ0790312.1 putative C2 domain-containing protein [Helianthus annuus]
MGTHECRSFHRLLHTPENPSIVFKGQDYLSQFFILIIIIIPSSRFSNLIACRFSGIKNSHKKVGFEIKIRVLAVLLFQVFMESPQSVVSPFKASSLYPEPENRNLNLFTKNPNPTTKKPEPELVLGVLQVHIHQARDIQNICIYHKQDVYAKICITSNPEKSVTTQTINGGGQNPVFNETLQINVPTIDSSLKCEIYMLSRVRNYLEDQLLGFALIPLSEILIKNGKLENEFTLSSTDLFHSPSGFVHLSLSYTGASPDVIAISPPPAGERVATESELAEFDKIEFPDPKIANENHMMVSEYYGLSSESLVSSDTDDQTEPHVVEQSVEVPKPESPPTSVSTNESQCASQEYDSVPKEKEKPAKNGDLESENLVKKPIVTINTDFDEKVVQQDFVDLYMKSMQQFTESLAKMKLPLDVVEKEGPDSGKSGSDQKIQTPNGSQGRVFYGSRAFF